MILVLVLNALLSLVSHLELSVYNSLLYITGASESNQGSLLLLVQLGTCFIIAGIFTTPLFIVIYLLCMHYINPKFEEASKKKIEKKFNFERMESESDMSTVSRGSRDDEIF